MTKHDAVERFFGGGDMTALAEIQTPKPKPAPAKGAGPIVYRGKPEEPEGKGALQWADELDREPPRFVVDELIPADCLFAVFGAPKNGKSFFVIDLAYCVATGTPYHGRNAEEGFVVYVAGEGRRGVIARFDALVLHHGKPLDKIALRSGLPLNVPGSADRIIAEITAAMAERGLGDPAMIIIDTLKRNFAGDQNASKDMSIFVQSCDDIREAFPDSSVGVVNHSTHAEKDRMGGSIDLLAALDAEYKVEKKDGRVVVTNTNMKDAPEIEEPFAFDFKGYDLSHGRNAPVLIPADAPSATAKPPTKSQERGLRTFTAAAEKHGAKWEDGDGVKREHWKEAFRAEYEGEPSGVNSAFSQCIKGLKEASLIAQHGDRFQKTWKGGAGE